MATFPSWSAHLLAPQAQRSMSSRHGKVPRFTGFSETSCWWPPLTPVLLHGGLLLPFRRTSPPRAGGQGRGRAFCRARVIAIRPSLWCREATRCGGGGALGGAGGSSLELGQVGGQVVGGSAGAGPPGPSGRPLPPKRRVPGRCGVPWRLVPHAEQLDSGVPEFPCVLRQVCRSPGEPPAVIRDDGAEGSAFRSGLVHHPPELGPAAWVRTALLVLVFPDDGHAEGVRMAAVRDGVHVAFSVADDGRGLPAELIPMLFRKFARIEGGDREQGVAGSGLGLAICRGIVEAHGGRIRAESAGPGLGSRFVFTLPAAEDANGIPRDEPPRSTARPRRADRNRVRVLVVDDDPQTLRYVRDALSDAGYACVVTGDPDQVALLVEREKPNLVLLDLMLPGADGIGLMERVPGLSRVPVIFLSAYGGDQVIAQALEAGADDYIVKPFSPAELVARIRTALRWRAVPASAEPSQPFVLGELTIDYGDRRVSLAGRSIHLTGKEYRLLYELSVNAGRVVTHDELIQAGWSVGKPGHAGTLRTVMKNLRRKLGDSAAAPVHIFNEPRVGYRMPRAE